MNKFIQITTLGFITLGLLVAFPLSSMASSGGSTGGGGAGGLGKALQDMQIKSPVFLGMVKEITTHPDRLMKKTLVWPEEVYQHAYSWVEKANRLGKVTAPTLESFKHLELDTSSMMNTYYIKKGQVGDLVFATPSARSGVVDYHFVPPTELTDEGYELILNSGSQQLLRNYFFPHFQ